MDTTCESCNDSTERKKQDVHSNIFTQIHVHGHTHTYTLAPQMIPSTNVKTGKITLFGNTKIGSKTIFFRKQEKDYSGSEMNKLPPVERKEPVMREEPVGGGAPPGSWRYFIG